MSDIITDEPPTPFHRRCIREGCNTWVHRNQPLCKKCRTPSPWTSEGQLLLKGSFVVTEDFSATMDVGLMSFTAGQVLSDTATIQALLDGGCPIEQKTDSHVTHVCPHCHKSSLVNGGNGQLQLDASGMPRVTLPAHLLN